MKGSNQHNQRSINQSSPVFPQHISPSFHKQGNHENERINSSKDQSERNYNFKNNYSMQMLHSGVSRNQSYECNSSDVSIEDDDRDFDDIIDNKPDEQTKNSPNF